MIRYSLAVGLAATTAVLVLCSCDSTEPGSEGGQELFGELRVLHAGSLSIPMQRAGEAFAMKHPGIKVLTESHGSRTCARQISELGKAYDVFGSADYTVIDNLLIPDHAPFNLRFATNEMAIVLSRDADQVTAENWCDRLLDTSTRWGHSDPDQDPCGYRTLLVLQLAEKHYERPSFYERMLSHNGRIVRPKETGLLALVETGEIDYLFIYRSVAQQHGLDYIALPDEINLKDSSRTDLYAQAQVNVTGAEPGTRITKRGAPMVYGITVPQDAPNRRAALAFVEFMLGPEGQGIMESCGQGVIVPAVCEQYESLPDELKGLATALP